MVGAAGLVTVIAQSAPTLRARTIAASIAERDSAIVTSDAVALAGLFAANSLVGRVVARIIGSAVEAAGILVSADSADALIDATSDVSAVAATGELSLDNLPKLTLSAAMAVNLIGWVLASTTDALLAAASLLTGVNFGTAAPWKVTASAIDSRLDSSGDIEVSARSAETINATVSNTSEARANTLAFAFSAGAGLVLATSKILGETRADLLSTSNSRAAIRADGAVTVKADHAAGIFSNVKLTTASVTVNDGGVHLLADGIDLLAGRYDHLSTDGTVTLDFGDIVIVPVGATSDDFTAQNDIAEQVQTVSPGKVVRLADDYTKARHQTSLGVRYLLHGDIVLVEAGHDAGGDWDTLYRYLGASTRIDLEAEDFTVAPRWAVIGGEAGSAYRYLGSEGGLDLNSQDYSDTMLWVRVADKPLSMYSWMGPDGTVVDLDSEDLLDLGWWKPANLGDAFPSGFNITDSQALAISAAIVLNDVSSDVSAIVEYAAVDAGSLTVEAIEQATIQADADVTATASGGNSVTGEGLALAANGILATNRVLGGATAAVFSSVLDISGAIIVRALLQATVEASTRAALTTGAQGFGIVLAFNTIGWNPTATFFQLIEAILGSSVIGDHTAYGSEAPSVAQALIRQSTVSAGGAVELTADAAATVSSYVGNDATSFPAALFGAGGLAVNGVVSSNRVSSGAFAQLEGITPASWTLASPPASIETGDVVHTPSGVFQWTGVERGPPVAGENFAAPGWRRLDDIPSTLSAASLTLDAVAASVIGATTTLYSEVSPNNDAGSGLINKYLGDQLADYRFTSNSGTVSLDLGDRIRVADDYSGDNAGQVVQWMGPDGTDVDLSAADFDDADLWKLLTPTSLFTSSLAYALLGEIGTRIGKSLTGESKGYFGLVVSNDLRSEVIASITDVPVTVGGAIAVTASDSTSLTAIDSSTLVAWEGGGGVLAMNAVLGSADALVTNSPLIADGDLTVEATQNGDAVSVAETKVEAWAATAIILAFNSLGWTSQNLLSYLFEALFGVSGADIAARFGVSENEVVKAIFGALQPSAARALVTDSPLQHRRRHQRLRRVGDDPQRDGLEREHRRSGR